MNLLLVILLVVSLVGAKPLLPGHHASKRGFNGTHLLHVGTPLSAGDTYTTLPGLNAVLSKRVAILESRMNPDPEIPTPSDEEEIEFGCLYREEMAKHNDHDRAIEVVVHVLQQRFPGMNEQTVERTAFAWVNAGLRLTTTPDQMDVDDELGLSQQGPGNVGGTAGSLGSPSNQPKGKGKASEVLNDALIRRYETLGRTQYNAWLMAPDTATSGQLMSNALGQSTKTDNWQRAYLVTDLSNVAAQGRAWSSLDKTTELERTGGLTYVEPALSELKVGLPPAEGIPEWQVQRQINSKLYTTPRFEGPNLYYELEQDHEYTSGAKAPASGASYHTTFNVVDGVIIVHKNIPPTRAWLDNFPKSRTLPATSWSDLTWNMWYRIRASQKSGPRQAFQWDPSTATSSRYSKGHKEAAYPFSKIMPGMNFKMLNGDAHGWLNWIFVTNIEDQDTIDIMKNCLQSRGINGIPPFGSQDDSKLFVVGEWCFYALMATESSRMIPEFLAQHRDVVEKAGPHDAARNGLGHKMLASVVLFSTQTAPDQPAKPALAWSVSGDQAKVQEWMSTFEASWVCNVDDAGFHYAPSPLPDEIAGDLSFFQGSSMEE